MRFWILVLLSLSLLGCLKTTQEVDADLLAPDRDSKLYVLCFISPQDSVLSVKVALSEPKIVPTAEPSLVVKTATVTIRDEQQTITLPYDSTLGYYRIKSAGRFSIQAGRTYQLTVQMGENRQVTAQATVPAAIPIQRVQVDSALSISAGMQSILYTTTIFWNTPGGVNYYRGYGEFVQTVKTSGIAEETRTSQPSFFVDRENSTGPSVRSLTGTHILVAPSNARISTRQARIWLFSTDLNYYRYHSSLREQINTPNNSFAESTVLYSNIEGGYGVFAAYNASYRLIR